MSINILHGNDTDRKIYCVQAKKKKRLKHTSNSSCLIKCSELSASIVTSVISFDGIGHIIGNCHHPSYLWVCDWSIFDNKEMLTGLHGEAVTGKIPFTMSLPNCGAPPLPHMI